MGVELHPDTFKLFESRKNLWPFSFVVFFSGIVIGFGLIGLCAFPWVEQTDRALFLIVLFLMSCAYTAFIATEARFGLFGFVAASIGALHLFKTTAGRRIAFVAAPAVATYAALCLAIDAFTSIQNLGRTLASHSLLARRILPTT